MFLFLVEEDQVNDQNENSSGYSDIYSEAELSMRHKNFQSGQWEMTRNTGFQELAFLATFPNTSRFKQPRKQQS